MATQKDKEKPLPMSKNHQIHGLFLKDDILREHSYSAKVNNRGLQIYDTSTIPMTIEGNRFYDFITHNSFSAGIDLAQTVNTRAMSASLCFMRNNTYTNTPIRMNFARINNTLAYADAGTSFEDFGWDLESKDGKKVC